jgi:uncharacterized protein YbaR (Trm112 family)
VSLDPWLLEKLVCPVTRTGLRYDMVAQELISEAAGLAFPVRNGVPVMLIEEARRIGGARGGEV